MAKNKKTKKIVQLFLMESNPCKKKKLEKKLN